MGWFDGRSSSSHHRHHRSPYSSTHHGRHSTPSIYSLGSGGVTRHRGSSSSSIFSTSSSSSRRARPRAGFIQRVIHQIKRVLRDIYRYARRHTAKVLFMVVVPLLTSGVLPKLFAMIGVRLPQGLLGGKFAQVLGAGAAGSGSGGLMSLAKNFL
ncbi:hypothetical protein PHISP_02514 [Aspergillus sp. HF37]|nr:hypothetical protein PHISP_02514 [Aspergillus sp. HF37]